MRQLSGNHADKIESLRICCNHGADCGVYCGVSGFIYYQETMAFYKRQRKNIIELLNEVAGSCGENLIEMIANFKCLNWKSNDYWIPKIAMTLYGTPRQFDMTIANALAWFALEEIAREVCDK